MMHSYAMYKKKRKKERKIALEKREKRRISSRINYQRLYNGATNARVANPRKVTSQPDRQTTMKGGDPDTPSITLFASSPTTALDNNRRVKCISQPAIIEWTGCDRKLKQHSRSSVNVRSCISME